MRMFIMGTGSVRALVPPITDTGKAGIAAAWATASDTPRIALAPELALVLPCRPVLSASRRWGLLPGVHPDDLICYDGVYVLTAFWTHGQGNAASRPSSTAHAPCGCLTARRRDRRCRPTGYPPPPRWVAPESRVSRAYVCDDRHGSSLLSLLALLDGVQRPLMIPQKSCAFRLAPPPGRRLYLAARRTQPCCRA